MFRKDAYNFEAMGKIELRSIIFSNRIKEEWQDRDLWNKILENKKLKNSN